MFARPTLISLTRRRQFPPAVYVLINAIDTTHHVHGLPYNTDFWLVVQQELLPQVKTTAPFSGRTDRTVVAKQSFGGLSVLYAGLHWPERFDCALSQLGSYWWPHRDGHQEGMLLEQLNTGEVNAEGLRIVLEADVREPMVMQANQVLYMQLYPLKEPIFWCQVGGGYNALCQCGSLVQGLIDLWQPLFHDRG